jgi:16S rRNA G966 N2-methylase RsmD
VLCDNDRSANRIQHRNAEALGFSGQTEILLSDWKKAVRLLSDRGETFDLIFLDPPYRMTDLSEVAAALEGLLAEDGLVIVEHEAKADIRFGDGFEKTDERKWGFCGMSFYRKTAADAKGTEENE